MTAIKNINSSSTIRLLVALIAGVSAVIIGMFANIGLISILIGWEVAVLTFVIWIWCIIWPMGHERTAAFAVREDPGRVGVDIVLILASIASLGAVGFALFEAHATDNAARQLMLTLIGLFSVVVSWILIHTIYALRYARFYYSKELEGSIDFKRSDTRLL